jgi:amino acid permease
MDDFNKNFYNRFEIKLIFMYAVCAIVTPLCLLKDISKMKNASIFGLLSLLYVILVIVIQSPTYYSYYKENIYKPDDISTHINWWDFSAPFDPHTLYFFTGTATVIYSYTCHTGAFPVYKSLKRNVSVRINKVFMRSTIINTIVYLTVGICGFLTQPYTKDDLVIFRRKIPGSNDIAMTIARLLMATMVILFTPVNFNGFRLSFLSLFYKDTTVINNNNFL